MLAVSWSEPTTLIVIGVAAVVSVVAAAHSRRYLLEVVDGRPGRVVG